MNQRNQPDQEYSVPMGFWWRLWWVRPVALGLALVVGTYVFFEVRGRLRWKAHVARINAAGGSLELRKAIKNPAKEGDFWMDPAIIDLQDSPLSEGDKIYLGKVDSDYKPNYKQSINRTNGWRAAQAWTLESHYPKLNLTPRQAAERILEKLDPIAPDFDRLAAAAKKPTSAFPWPESIGEAWDTEFGLLHKWRGVADIMSFRALCLLKTDQAAQAASDIQTAFRLAGHLQSRTLTIDLIFVSAILSIAQQPLWEGLEAQIWDESALAGLQDTLSDLPNEKIKLRDMLTLEEVFFTYHFNTFYSTSGKRWSNFSYQMGQPVLFNSGDSIFSRNWLQTPVEYLDRFCFAAIPSGVLRENLIYRHELNAATLLNPTLPIRDGIKAESTEISRIQDAVIRIPSQALNQYSLGDWWERYLRTIDELERISAAVAAERYQLKHGDYPATWKDLVPVWLPSAPQDFWSGRDQIYALDPDGRPVIYSVGENLIDEGGLPKRNLKLGDRVWRYSLPPGFTVQDYLKK